MTLGAITGAADAPDDGLPKKASREAMVVGGAVPEAGRVVFLDRASAANGSSAAAGGDRGDATCGGGG